MATWYVNSAAVGTGAGTSWANACTTLAAAIALSSVGDDFNVKNTHAETQASAITLAFKGTVASPNRVFSTGSTNAPATASDILAGASITTTGASALTVNGYVRIEGVTFNIGTGTTAANSNWATGAATSDVTLVSCAVNHLVTTATNAMNVGSTSAVTSRVKLVNTPVGFAGGASSGIVVNQGLFEWLNTASAVGGASAATITALFPAFTRSCFVYCDGLDLTGLGSSKKVFAASAAAGAFAQLVNCKLTSGITVAAAPFQPGSSVDVYVSDSGATGYRQERYWYQATLTTETTVVNTASDGTTTIAWKVATTANAKRQAPFECFTVNEWVDTTGGSLTATIQCVTDTNTDATALKDSDIWVDAQVLDNASFPLSGAYTSAPATQLTAGSTLSAGTWATTTGMTTPDKRKMTVTFTPGIKGLVRFTVKVARASLTTLRIDPKVTIA